MNPMIKYKLSEKCALKSTADAVLINQMLDDIVNTDISLENFMKLIICTDSINNSKHSNLREAIFKYRLSTIKFHMHEYKEYLPHNPNKFNLFSSLPVYNKLLIDNNVIYNYNMSLIEERKTVVNNAILFYLQKQNIKATSDVEISEHIDNFYNTMSSDDVIKMIDFGIFEMVEN